MYSFRGEDNDDDEVDDAEDAGNASAAAYDDDLISFYVQLYNKISLFNANPCR